MPTTTNSASPQFRSLRDQLRFNHQRDHLVETEKDTRRKLISQEINSFNNLVDSLVRNNILERQKDSDKRRFFAKEIHFRNSIEEERLAWCLVIEDLMKEYEQQIVRNERERTGKWKSVRIPHQHHQSRRKSDTTGFEYQAAKSATTLEGAEDDAKNATTRTNQQPEVENEQRSPASPVTSNSADSFKIGGGGKGDKSMLHDFGLSPAARKKEEEKKARLRASERGRPNPFITLIERDESVFKIPEIVKKRIDDMLVTHGKRNDQGTNVVERSAEQRKKEQLAMAKSRSESVRASSLMVARTM
jgi:hypothetical protein